MNHNLIGYEELIRHHAEHHQAEQTLTAQFDALIAADAEKIAEILNLRAERDALQSELIAFKGAGKMLLDDNVRLQAEVERLREALGLFLEWCDMPQVDPEGPHNDDYGAVMFDKFRKAEEAARAALEVKP